MEKPIVNAKSVRMNHSVKVSQRIANKFYGEKLFDFSKTKTKTRIPKIVDVMDVSYLDLSKSEKTECPKLDSREDLEKLLRDNSISGRSGSDFDTSKKLETIKNGEAVLIVNGVECDPGLVHDSWIYRNILFRVAEGIMLLDRFYSFKKKILATKEVLKDADDSFEQVRVKAKFPAGYEKTLIENILGVKLVSKDIPAEKGILVLNIQTVLAIAELAGGIKSGKCRYLTFANLSIAKAVVVKAEYGTSVKSIAEKLMFNSGDEIYCGTGALSCHPVSSDETVTSKTCFIAAGKMPAYENAKKCVGCGNCSRKCPSKVMVKNIVGSFEKNKANENVNYSAWKIENCIGCGACTYFCAAGKDVRSIVACAKNNYN